MIAAAVGPAQVTGDKCIPGAIGLVMFAVAAFNIFDVITQGAHGAAEETGAELVAEFG